MKGRWRDVEDISVLEIRTVVRAAFDLLKYEHMHRHRLLFLGDNMGVVLACCRSRARSFRFIVQLRKLASFSFIMGVKISFRWIPSELNSSDLASRVYEEGPLKYDILEHLDSVFENDNFESPHFSQPDVSQNFGSVVGVDFDSRPGRDARAAPSTGHCSDAQQDSASERAVRPPLIQQCSEDAGGARDLQSCGSPCQGSQAGAHSVGPRSAAPSAEPDLPFGAVSRGGGGAGSGDDGARRRVGVFGRGQFRLRGHNTDLPKIAPRPARGLSVSCPRGSC